MFLATVNIPTSYLGGGDNIPAILRKSLTSAEGIKTVALRGDRTCYRAIVDLDFMNSDVVEAGPDWQDRHNVFLGESSMVFRAAFDTSSDDMGIVQASVSAPNSPCCASDFNGDGQVTAADLSVYLGSPSPVVRYRGGDANGDGLVNGADLSVLLSQVDEPCP